MSVTSAEDYKAFQHFLQTTAGITLGDNKQYLVTSRLNKLMSQHEIQSLGELVKRIEGFSERTLREAVVDAMTTNETLWFRDNHPFTIFRERLLPEFQQQAAARTRIWSAACSSGQEPYSLSMLVEEYNAANRLAPLSQVDIVATDLSRGMLQLCARGEYDELSLGRGLSSERLRRFFNPLENGRWQVKDEVKQRVRFQYLNLKDSFNGLGKFDLIFCRNVLIYFTLDLKIEILKRMHASLRPGGYLVLGASEGLTGLGDYYQMVQCNPGLIYQAVTSSQANPFS